MILLIPVLIDLFSGNINYLIIYLILLIPVFINLNESFVPYQANPNTIYSKWYTGTQPLNFYNYPIYRKPYRDGFKISQSYPYPHYNSLGFQLDKQ